MCCLSFAMTSLHASSGPAPWKSSMCNSMTTPLNDWKKHGHSTHLIMPSSSMNKAAAWSTQRCPTVRRPNNYFFNLHMTSLVRSSSICLAMYSIPRARPRGRRRLCNRR